MNRYEAAEAAVSKAFGMPIELVKSGCRQWEVSEVRQALWFVLRYAKETYTDIADEYELDHTSIIHGVNVAKKNFKKSPWYRARLEEAWTAFNEVLA